MTWHTAESIFVGSMPSADEFSREQTAKDMFLKRFHRKEDTTALKMRCGAIAGRFAVVTGRIARQSPKII